MCSKNVWQLSLIFNSSSRTAFPTQDRFSSAEDATEANAMSMQLSITLAVGFFLLFANIIIFAVVSYRKEKDKILIEVRN